MLGDKRFLRTVRARNISYYGNKFRAAALTQRPDVENIPKADLFSGLQRATEHCPKGEYSKGGHSFQILALIDPAKVKSASAYADRFLDLLDQYSR
jgi:hypothetical protein